MSGLRASAAAVLALAVLAGCGGSEGEGTDEATYRAQAGELCTQFREETTAVLFTTPITMGLPPAEFASSPKLVEATSRTLEAELLPRYAELVERLRAIEPPMEYAEAIDSILDAYEGTYEQYSANPISMIDPDADAAIDEAEEKVDYELVAERACMPEEVQVAVVLESAGQLVRGGEVRLRNADVGAVRSVEPNGNGMACVTIAIAGDPGTAEFPLRAVVRQEPRGGDSYLLFEEDAEVGADFELDCSR